MGQRGSRQEQDDGDITWWFKFLAKGVGVLAGLIAMSLGIFACATVHATCLLAGILQLFLGFFMVVFEAPCCCQCLDFVDTIGKFSDNRPPWQKAVAYCLPPILPVVICAGISTIVGCGAMFVTGALYGMMALGKKADRETMRARAVAGDDTEMTVTLVKNEESAPSGYTSLPAFNGEP